MDEGENGEERMKGLEEEMECELIFEIDDLIKFDDDEVKEEEENLIVFLVVNVFDLISF